MISVALAVLAALANATSSTLQRKANVDEPDSAAFSPRLILDLLHRPVWFGGILAVIAGFLLQAAALAHGELAVVEPILDLELPFTLALASLVFARRLHRREWTAATLMTAGLALFIGALRPHGGSATRAGALTWGLGVTASVVVIAVVVTVALRSGPVRRASMLGVATGATFGLTAAFMTGMSEALRHDLPSVFVQWQTYAMVASGLTAMWLLQNALQAGSLVAVQPGLTLTDPVVSVLWGIMVFHERVHAGGWLAMAVAGAALIGGGTVMLSGSNLISAPERSEGTEAPRT